MSLRCRIAAVCAVFLFAVASARAQVLTEPVGTTSPVETATVAVTTAGTLGAINVLTQGAQNLDFNFMSGGNSSKCVIGNTYNVGQTCTVQFTFTPMAPGTRYGGITLMSGNTLLGNSYVSGIGVGPLLTFGSGTPSVIGSSFINPSNIAVDASGNIFVAVWGGGLVQEIVAAGGYATTNTLGSGFFHPWAVAVDGSGNIFVTDLGTMTPGTASVKEIVAAGGYTTIKTLSNSFIYPGGIAVDANGNVFVSDSTAGTVSEMTVASGYTTVNVLAQANGHFNSPAGLALDANSNLFVSDTNNNAVKELLAIGGYNTVNTLGSGYNFPTSIAVDANENIYVTNHGNGTAEEFLAASGYVTTKSLANGYYVPLGIALDGVGNVFVINAFGAEVVKLDYGPSTLTFATTMVGSTSSDSPQTVTLINTGNSALTFGVPGSGSNPSITSGFTIGSNSTCPQISASSVAGTLAAGASCTDQVSFTPVTTGTPVSGQLVITDNSLNAAVAQTVLLSGIATPYVAPVATTSTLTASPNPVVLGNGVTLTATVAPNPASTAVPTGTVTFYLGGTSGTSLGVVTLANGIATYNTVPLPFGNESVTCVYSGDSNFSGSTCNAVTVSVINPTLSLREPVGTSSGTILLAVTVTAPGTLSGTHVVTQGATGLDFSLVQLGVSDGLLGGCGSSAPLTVGQTCALGFQFKPTKAGLRLGAITLVSTTGTVLGTTYLSGIGVGPQITFPPGVQSVLSTAFTQQPTSVVVDGSGNLFIGNSGTASNVEEFPANGGTPVVIASGFGELDGLAIDGAGNLFVSDRAKNKITELMAFNGYATAVPISFTAFSQLVNVAVDANGNLYASDASLVWELPFSSGYTTATNIGSGFNNPCGLAVDASGDVFVADQANHVIKEVVAVNGTIPASPTITTFPFNVGSAISLAIDGEGNIYAGSLGTGPVVEIFAASNYTTSMNLGSGYLRPDGLFVDGSGNLFIADTGNYRLVKIDLADPPALSFATTIVGSTSSDSPQTVTFYNDGNAPLTNAGLGPITGQTITAGFTLGAGSTCPYVAPGASCTDLISFTPVTAGNPVSGKMVTTDNNLNAAIAIQTVPLSGIALTALPQTITFLQPATPEDAGTSALLNATASSGLPVTFSIVSGPATVSGSVVTYTGAGVVVIEADQAGNASYSAAAPVQQSVTVVLLNEPVGTQSAPVTTLVTFTAAGTLGTINVLTQGAPNLDFKYVPGGTCTVGTPYSAGATCTVEFSFTPARPGLRYGGIPLTSTTGTTIANAYVYGLGTGPQVTYAPGTQSLLGSGLTNPSGVAVDGSGDIFVSTCIDLCDNTGTSNSNGLSEILPNGTVVNIGSFVQGDDVAVDGSGNVFIIWNRTDVSEVLAVNGVIPASPVINLLASNFVSLDGMKVDGNGNVYVADGASATTGKAGGIYELLAVNGSMPASPTIVQIGANNTVLTSPTGVAIDAAGDVFESDETNDAAYELMAVNGVVPASPVVKTIASNLPEPTNIALDAAGNVFVSVVGPAGVYEALAQGGYSTVVPLGTGFSEADGLAVDASGNVFVADNSLTQVVKLDFADAPSLTFATTQVGSTSTDSPQTATVTNDGNANLMFLPPASGTDPSITAGFTFTSTCPVLSPGPQIAYAVPSGGSCVESISFTPVTAGLDTGALTLTDNNLNVAGAQQNIKLNATGTSAPTTLTLISSANPVYALQPITFTVHLTTNGQGDAGQTVLLTYTVGTLVVTASLTTDATGSASYAVVGGLNPGSYVVSAAFAGTTSYLASSATITEVVNAIPTTSTLTVFPAQPVVNTNIVLTAVVAAQLSGPPTGQVTFFNGTTVLGTVALSSAGVAQFTIGSLPVGNYSFTCTYNGATDYATSNCQTISDTVVPLPDFSLTATPPSITIETEHHKTMQLTLTGIGLFSGPVYLGCQGPLPPYLTCELPQSETLAVGQTLNFNFTMDTDAVLDFLAKNPPAEKTPWTNAPGKMTLALLLPLALAGFARRRKTLRRLLLLAVLVIGATGLTACGDKWPGHTPPGTYTIPVVGTGTYNGTTITHTLNITLTVTP